MRAHLLRRYARINAGHSRRTSTEVERWLEVAVRKSFNDLPLFAEAKIEVFGRFHVKTLKSEIRSHKSFLHYSLCPISHKTIRNSPYLTNRNKSANRKKMRQVRFEHFPKKHFSREAKTFRREEEYLFATSHRIFLLCYATMACWMDSQRGLHLAYRDGPKLCSNLCIFAGSDVSPWPSVFQFSMCFPLMEWAFFQAGLG